MLSVGMCPLTFFPEWTLFDCNRIIPLHNIKPSYNCRKDWGLIDYCNSACLLFNFSQIRQGKYSTWSLFCISSSSVSRYSMLLNPLAIPSNRILYPRYCGQAAFLGEYLVYSLRKIASKAYCYHTLDYPATAQDPCGSKKKKSVGENLFWFQNYIKLISQNFVLKLCQHIFWS